MKPAEFQGSMSQAESLRRALSKRGIKELTPNAVLTALEEEGIRSLEDYAKKLIEVAQKGRGEPQRIDIDALANRPPSPEAASIRHNVPEVPFIANGTLYDPKDIARFDGQELLYVHQKDALLIYTDRKVSAMLTQTLALLGMLGEAGAPPTTTRDLPPFILPFPPAGFPGQGSPEWVVFYEDIEFGGAQLFLNVGYEFPDLTDVSMDWPFGGDWNDEISSISFTRDVCICFEHINHGGSQLVTFGDRNLHTIGWGDRISSMMHPKTVFTHT